MGTGTPGTPATPAGSGHRPGLRVFVSVAGPDLDWGRWVDRQLRDAGYQVDFYPRTFPAGANFVDLIDDALERADRVVALLSPAYVDRRSWVREEWQAALRLAHDRPPHSSSRCWSRHANHGRCSAG